MYVCTQDISEVVVDSEAYCYHCAERTAIKLLEGTDHSSAVYSLLNGQHAGINIL